MSDRTPRIVCVKCGVTIKKVDGRWCSANSITPNLCDIPWPPMEDHEPIGEHSVPFGGSIVFDFSIQKYIIQTPPENRRDLKPGDPVPDDLMYV